MKIEIGESLLQSYLKHVKKCTLAQLNWKVSSNWTISENDKDKVNLIFNKIKSNSEFSDVITTDLSQTLKQAEIDVVGTNSDNTVYFVEVAFHEEGLNYGSKIQTKNRVIKKLLRALLIGYAYFPNKKYEIIFASPKVNNATQIILNDYFTVLKRTFEEDNVNFIFYSNDNFKNEILEKTISKTSNDEDSSELFFRAFKMLDLFEKIKTTNNYIKTNKLDQSEYENTNTKCVYASRHSNNQEVKIGKIVKTKFFSLLSSSNIPEHIFEKLQDKDYSKENLGINYAVLKLITNNTFKKIPRYYKEPIITRGNKYYHLCSEWYKRNMEQLNTYLTFLEKYV